MRWNAGQDRAQHLLEKTEQNSMEQNIEAEEIQRPSQALGTHLQRPRGGKTLYLWQTALWAPRWAGRKTGQKRSVIKNQKSEG